MCYEPMGPARNGTNDQLANNLAQNAVVQPVLGCIGKAMPPETDAGGAQGTSNLRSHVFKIIPESFLSNSQFCFDMFHVCCMKN